MRYYDEENKADDDRNSKMSDLAQENNTLSYQNHILKLALAEIREVWAGSDGCKIRTATEQYLENLCKQQYRISVNAESLIK